MSEKNEKRPQFGNRHLKNPNEVFQHNAWDNVEWDDEQEQEAKKKVEANSQKVVQQDQQDQYEAEADRFWDEFYGQHQNRFFKDRHWLFTEFPELLCGMDEKILHKFPQKIVSGDAGSSDKVVENSAEEKLEICGNNIDNSGQTSDENIQNLVTMKVTDSVSESDSHLKCDNSEESKNTESAHKCDDGASNNSVETSKTETIDHSMINESSIQDVKKWEPISRENEQFPGENSKFRVFEVGCGVGNTVFPILETNNDPGVYIYCCDLSATAIQLVKDHRDYAQNRCHGFVCDVTKDAETFPFPDESLDVITLIFVMSAIHPDKMQGCINRLAVALKPGGVMLFRDYGRYDLAQLRFKNGRCLSENFYVRGDGTRVYFFTQEELRGMFTTAGLTEVQNYVDRRLQVNRGKMLKMYRVWIQCKYKKPDA